MVVTVPDAPRYLSAPPSTYIWPTLIGDVVGGVLSKIAKTRAALVPATVVPTQKFPLVSRRAFSAELGRNTAAPPESRNNLP